MPKLYEEDQQKVDAYLNENVNSVERIAFKPWTLLGIIGIVLVLLTVVSFIIAKQHGVV